MKNPTILKGELSLLRADKSAVIAELRKTSKLIKEGREEVNDLYIERKGAKADILEEMARLDDITSRAVFVREELKVLTQDLKNRVAQSDVFDQKNSQERRIHLGRIKELKQEEEDSILEINRLKHLFDKNSLTFNSLESERESKLKETLFTLVQKERELAQLIKRVELTKAEEKKVTKDRLKREDKIRLREKNLDGREVSIGKREEDLITMSKDMTIMYGRLKELYSKASPKVNLDKLIIQAL